MTTDSEYRTLRENAYVRSYRTGIGLVSGAGADLTPQKDGSFHFNQIEKFIQDLFYEPDWRSEAEIASAFYDGDQLTRETLLRMQEYGLLPTVINHIGPIVDAVAGMETIIRKDVRCVSLDDYSYEPGLAMNATLKQATKKTSFHHKVGLQFKESTTTGLSWLEVGREIDPFKYKYKVERPPWREMYFDWRARKENLEDARYYVRRQWFDEDELLKYFPDPKQQDIIKKGTRNKGIRMDGYFSMFENSFYGYHGDYAGTLSSNLYSEHRWSLEEEELMMTDRPRIGLIEVLYYVPKRVSTIELRTGHVIEYDKDSDLHRQALNSGHALKRSGVTNIWRQAFYLGSESLLDRPLALNSPHYIPMICFRKNGSGAPYGMVKRAISPQENINAKWIRMNYELSSSSYFADADAVDNHEKTARELNKVNSYIVLKEERRSELGIRERQSTETQTHTYRLLQEAKGAIHDVTGIHPEFMGQIQSAGQSGYANTTLIEQTAQVLGGMIENYKQSKLASTMRLFKLIITDMMMFTDWEQEVQEQGSKSKVIVLNARGSDGVLKNDLMMAMLEVELESVPMSETYRQQKFQQLSEIIKSMPEEFQMWMYDLVILAAQLPQGEEILERLQEKTGYGPPPKDPQKRQEMEQQQMEQQQKQVEAEQLQQALAEAELQLKVAKAELEVQKAKKLAGADTEYTDAKTITEMAKVESQMSDSKRKDVDSQANLMDKAARLRQVKKSDNKN